MKRYPPAASGAPLTHTNTRPVFVPDSLSTLRGPAAGTVSLPLRLDWSRAASYDLARPTRLRTMYATVLREAISEDDLAEFLNETLLRQHWTDLNLPRFTRRVWETTHPELRRIP